MPTNNTTNNTPRGYFTGILDVYVAKMLTPDSSAAKPTYDTPRVLGMGIEVTITPQYREGQLYASNRLARNKKVIDHYDIKFNADVVSPRTTPIFSTARPIITAFRSSTATAIPWSWQSASVARRTPGQKNTGGCTAANSASRPSPARPTPTRSNIRRRPLKAAATGASMTTAWAWWPTARTRTSRPAR